MSTTQAIALLELDSVAVGTRVADAMVKRSPVRRIRIGTVQPGKYLILVGGSVAEVEEAHLAGLCEGGEALLDEIILPGVHEQVLDALDHKRRKDRDDALGILEFSSIPASVLAADVAVKSANISIVEIRLGDGLGGSGITHLTGKVEDVQFAIEAGVASVRRAEVNVRSVVIPQLHPEIQEQLGQSTSFSGSG